MKENSRETDLSSPLIVGDGDDASIDEYPKSTVFNGWI
jgi:hypothetical protein